MQPFDHRWADPAAGARDPHEHVVRVRQPVRRYRVDYQASAEAGHLTLRSQAQLTATLLTQARVLLEAHGIRARIRRLTPIADHQPRPLPPADPRPR